MNVKRSWLVVVATCSLSVLCAGLALAHGDLRSAEPEPGSVMDGQPRRVVLTFSEAPTDDGVLKVRDGCSRNAIESAKVSGSSIRARLTDAAPGRWRVRYTVISSVDGHVSRGSYSFRVRGAKDCSAPQEDEDDPRTGDGDDPSDQAGGLDTDGSAGEDSGPPWLLFLLGTAGLMIVAYLIRRRAVS